MTMPDPFPGLVIRYGFLWSDEARRGRSEGTKDRPAVIILAQRRREDGALVVIVAPIIHRPADADRAIEIPPKVKKYLGLDDDASYIILDELNRFVWPGPDLRPLILNKPGLYSSGVLPVDLYRKVQETAARLLLERRAAIMTRIE